jgi:putative hemolysin
MEGALESASKKMHSETRRRQFGSDMEILARAFCAEKGWNALISRRRRGCLACAIREAGALGWKVIIRVD